MAKIEKSRRLQSIWVTLARMAAAIFTMAIPMVLARVLDQTTFGYYKQLFLIATTVSALLTLGIPGSLYYFVPRSPAHGQRYMTQSVAILGVLGILGGVGIVVAAPAIEQLFNGAPLGPYLPLIALFTALSMPAELIPVSPMVDRRARLAAALVTGLDLVRALLLVVVAIVTRDLVAIIAVTVVVVGLKLAFAIIYLIWRRTRHAWQPASGLVTRQLAYILPFAGTAVIGLLRNKVHAFFVAANFSAADFAIYAVATLSIPLIGQFTQTVGEVVILENSRNFAENRSAEMRRIWHRATYSLGLVLIPIYIIGVAFAHEIMVVLFGPAYWPAAPIFRIYLSVIPLSLLLASPMLRATADLKLMLFADSVSLLVAVVSLLLLLGPLGPAGAITSLVLARATFILLASKRTAQRLELSAGNFLPWRSFTLMAALAGGACLLALGLTGGMPVTVRLFVGGGLAGALYTLVALTTGLIPASERELIGEMLRRGLGGQRKRSSGGDSPTA